MTRQSERVPDTTESIDATFDQVCEARDMLLLPASAYLRLSFPSLDQLVGPIAPGDVWFFSAFSGNGKTALLMSLVLALLTEGRTVYYLGLESRPKILRTHLACARLGYDVGDVLSGAAKRWPEWPSVRAELIADLERDRALGMGRRLIVNGRRAIDVVGLTDAAHEAAFASADLVIVDHIDHVALDESTNAYQQSRLVTQQVLRLAQDHGSRWLVASQLNNDAVRGDRLAAYAPPQPHHVYMGAHKRMIATGMLGLYRPQRTDATKAELGAVRDGSAEPSTVLEPHTMGVVCMKHRYFGNREGQRIALGVSRGCVSEIGERDRYATDHDAQRRI